jgi:hypothetical protein
MVAEHKVLSRSCGGFWDDAIRTRSCTPSDNRRFDGRPDGCHSAQSWHGCTPLPPTTLPVPPHIPSQAPATFDVVDCNPLFWAWLHSQGIHSLDTLGNVQKLHNEWHLQGCPGPLLGGNIGMARSIPGGHNSALSLPCSRTASPAFLEQDPARSEEMVRTLFRAAV